MNLSRRSVVMLAGGSLVAGCSELNRSPFWATLANARRPSKPAITREQIEKIEYATMLAWFDGGSRALLVLGSYEAGGGLTWYSAERQSVTTQGPFVSKLTGLDVTLRETTYGSGWISDLRSANGQRVERTQEFQSGTSRATVITRSRFSVKGREKIEIVGQAHSTIRVDEVAMLGGRRRVSNSYWIDDRSGVCVKARQIVIPTMPHFNFEVTRTSKAN